MFGLDMALLTLRKCIVNKKDSFLIERKIFLSQLGFIHTEGVAHWWRLGWHYQSAVWTHQMPLDIIQARPAVPDSC